MNDMTIESEDKSHAVVPFRKQLEDMAGQFQAALPAHIPVERFTRVVMTAIQQTPELLTCERRSLWNAAIRAAQDGLLPDGREAAMVIYKDKDRGPIVQYMPMIAGIRKKVRNSGEIATWDVYVVHANDEFAYELGDEPYIKHRPILDGDPGKVIAAYSVATLKSGEKSREVMTIAQIEKVRAVSRAKDSKFGPWVNWYEEMCRKTVARRHSKVLPMSTDLDDLIRQDDALYDFDGARDEAAATRPKSLAGKLDLLAQQGGSEPAQRTTAGMDEADEDGVVREKDPEPPAAETSSEAKPKTTREKRSVDKKPEPDPKPEAASKAPDERAAPTDAPKADDPPARTEAAAPTQLAPLTQDERGKLKLLADALAGAMSESGLQRGSSRFYADHEVEEGTALEAAASRIFSAHMERVQGRLAPAEVDHIVKKVLAS